MKIKNLVRNILLSSFALLVLAGSASADFVTRDFDGDGKSDYSVFRPSTGTFYIVSSATGATSQIAWGAACDRVIDGDFDGDGRADVGIWRPSTGDWWIKPSSGTPNSIVRNWGLGVLGDIPVTGDYDGDGKSDMGIYRPSTGSGASQWFVVRSLNNWNTPSLPIANWGTVGDIPVAATYKDCNCP